MTLSSVSVIGCHHKCLCFTQDHYHTHTRSCSVYSGLVDKQYTMSFFQMAKTLYSQQLARVQQALKQNEPDIFNAKHRVVWVAKDTTRRLRWETLGHQPFSLTIASTDLHILHSLDNHLRVKPFANEVYLWQAITDIFASKSTDFYHQGIGQLKARWKNGLNAVSGYFKDERYLVGLLLLFHGLSTSKFYVEISIPFF